VGCDLHKDGCDSGRNQYKEGRDNLQKDRQHIEGVAMNTKADAPLMTLQQDYALGPMVVLGEGAVSQDTSTPVVFSVTG
jgi:acyl-CoA synthetase (NDP forming)